MSLLIAYSGAFGGAERVLIDVAGAPEGDVWLACPPGPLAQAAVAAGLRVLTLRRRPLALRPRGRGACTGMARVRAVGALIGHGREIDRLMRDLEPDVVGLWGMRPAIAWLLSARRAAGAAGGAASSRAAARDAARARVVIAHHDMLPGPAIGRLVRAAAARADAVVVNSKAVAADLDPDGVLASRLSVVYPGVEALPGPLGPADSAGPVVLIAGALVAWKRVDTALDACALARRQLSSLLVRVVGAPLADDDDGTLARLRYRAALPDLAGAVRFVGAVDDLADELAGATCLLHCAEREPFGLVVAEALAAGRPVVVPAAGGPAEIADDRCGVLYPSGDARAAAAAIVSLARDPERALALGEAGRRRIAASFSREQMLRGFARALSPDGGEPLQWRESRLAGPGPRLAEPGPAGAAPGLPLALVTVSFNSAGPLRALLRSAARHLPGARVIVVDCGSSDDSVRVAREHPAAVSIDAGGNLGFGRGSNLGLAHVTEPVAVFVNPDVELVDDSLLALAEALTDTEARGERLLLAPLVLSSDGSRQDTVHPAPGTAAELARLVLPPGVIPGAIGAAIAPWRSRRPRPVGWAVACALAGATETLRGLGPFSDSIFMYGEDLELGLRAAGAGIQTWFWPHARVLHHSAHSTVDAFGGEPFNVLAHARHRAIAMTLGEPAARRDDRWQVALFASRAVVKRALRRDHRRELAQLRAVRNGRREFRPGGDGG